MAGNRNAFEEAIQAATNAAWDQDWEKAVAAYQRALAEFPEDINALMGLGLAQAGAGQVEAALDAYQRASALAPPGPVLLERIGDAQEQLGHRRAAAEAYMASAERYLSKQEAPHLALERWLDAVRVWPDHLQAHIELLRHYQKQGQARKAVAECKALARIYQNRGKDDYASRICEHALKLAPHDPEVLAMLESLRYAEEGGEPEEAVAEEVETGTAREAEILGAMEEPGGGVTLDFPTAGVETVEDRSSPVAIARRKALSNLAESVFEEEEEAPPLAEPPRLSKIEIDALIGRAIDFQTRGEVKDAIDAYEQVIGAGAGQPAVHFNLGLLYQENLRFDEAIEQFELAVSHPEYVLGSHFALGECYRAQGHIDEALEHFIEVLKIVDLATVRRDQADDLIQLYEHLADGYVAKGDREQALQFTNSLVTFLSEQGWEDKVIQARQKLDVLAEEGPAFSLAEMLATQGSERILKSISLSQEYSKRGMFYTALEECYSALSQSATYLPTHRQLAQVMLDMGKVENAVAKMVVIGDTYLAHDNIRRAIATYKRALKLGPMNTAVRAKLIDVLVSHGQIEDALEHFLSLADSYRNLAQMDQARETYQEALRLAPRGDPGRRWSVRILHKIGDIDMQRVDWKRAIGIYEQVRKLAPEDERARLTLMELYHRLGRPELAVNELDGLLNVYREKGKTRRIFTILEDLVGERPDDIPLRTRLAQTHLDAGNVDQALEHLDKLGDLQLDAGRVEEAKATVRAIVALNPPNVEEYQELLEQLGGQP